MAKKTNSELFSSVLYIIIGILLVIFRSETIGWAMTVAGIVFVISGILELIKKNFVGGGISLVIGIAILVLGWTVAKIVILVLGILVAIKGILALVAAINKSKKNALDFVFPVLTTVGGLMLAFGNLADIMIVIAGVLLIIDGAIGLFNSLKN